jgi:hypothetical protein
MADYVQFRTLRRFIGVSVFPIFVGCTTTSDWCQDIALRTAARQAYAQQPPDCKVDGSESCDYAAGWRQAYYDIAQGGDACPPSVPPSEYCCLKFRDTSECNKIAAWYRGYHQGAAAAQRDGLHVKAGIPSCVQCVPESACECSPVPPFRKKGFFDYVEEYGSTVKFEQWERQDSVEVAKVLDEKTPALTIDPIDANMIEDQTSDDLGDSLASTEHDNQLVDGFIEDICPMDVERALAVEEE